VADHLLVVEPGRFRVIDGNYDTYLHLVRQGLMEGERTRRGRSADAFAVAAASPRRREPQTASAGNAGSRTANWPTSKPTSISGRTASRRCTPRWPTPRSCGTAPRIKQTTAELEQVKQELADAVRTLGRSRRRRLPHANHPPKSFRHCKSAANGPFIPQPEDVDHRFHSIARPSSVIQSNQIDHIPARD
jgi:hypothetical protein